MQADMGKEPILVCMKGSSHGRSGRYDFARSQQDHIIHRFVAVVVDQDRTGGEQHAVGNFATDFAWSQVRDDDDLFSDEGIGFVILAHARTDLPRSERADVELQFEQAVSVGMMLRGGDGRDAQIDLEEIIEFNDRLGLRRVVSGRVGGSGGFGGIVGRGVGHGEIQCRKVGFLCETAYDIKYCHGAIAGDEGANVE